MAQTIVAVKLVPSELEALDQLVCLKGFASRSAALRAGLGMLFDQAHLSRAHEQKIERERCKHKPKDRRDWGKGCKLPANIAAIFAKERNK